MSRRNARARAGLLARRRDRRKRKVVDPDPIRRHVDSRHTIERCRVLGKLRYRGERHAERALRALAAGREVMVAAGLREPDAPIEIRAYECGHCAGWHTTSEEAYDARSSGEKLAEVPQAAPEGLQQVQRGEDHQRAEQTAA